MGAINMLILGVLAGSVVALNLGEADSVLSILSSHNADGPCGHMFSCGNGACVQFDEKCNGVNNCGNNADELGCNCTGKVTCADTSCTTVGPAEACDGTNNCYDHSDEYNCGTCNTTTHFECGNGECILLAARCDMTVDCFDRTDELACNCTALSAFACTDTTCVAASKECDGAADCADMSDEASCTAVCNTTTHFACAASNACIPIAKQCDWTADCYDNSDEFGCNCSLLTPNPLVCADTSCASGVLCDRTFVCHDFSDEVACGTCEQEFCIEETAACDAQCVVGMTALEVARAAASCDGLEIEACWDLANPLINGTSKAYYLSMHACSACHCPLTGAGVGCPTDTSTTDSHSSGDFDECMTLHCPKKLDACIALDNCVTIMEECYGDHSETTAAFTTCNTGLTFTEKTEGFEEAYGLTECLNCNCRTPVLCGLFTPEPTPTSSASSISCTGALFIAALVSLVGFL